MQVEEPEDGYIPNPGDGEGNKRSASTDTKHSYLVYFYLIFMVIN